MLPRKTPGSGRCVVRSWTTRVGLSLGPGVRVCTLGLPSTPDGPKEVDPVLHGPSSESGAPSRTPSSILPHFLLVCLSVAYSGLGITWDRPCRGSFEGILLPLSRHRISEVHDGATEVHDDDTVPGVEGTHQTLPRVGGEPGVRVGEFGDETPDTWKRQGGRVPRSSTGSWSREWRG